jgi:hypothetical protein
MPSLSRPPFLDVAALAGVADRIEGSVVVMPKAAIRAKKSRRLIFPCASKPSSFFSSDIITSPSTFLKGFVAGSEAKIQILL